MRRSWRWSIRGDEDINKKVVERHAAARSTHPALVTDT